MLLRTLAGLIRLLERSSARREQRDKTSNSVPPASSVVLRSSTCLVDLPTDLLAQIINKLPPDSVAAVSRTCKAFYVLVKRERMLTRLGRRIVKSSIHLLDLPTALLSYVLGHLSPESVATMSHTCKAFYILLRHERMVSRLKHHSTSTGSASMFVLRQPTRLPELPVHILANIIKYLPAECTAALSLTCVGIYIRSRLVRLQARLCPDKQPAVLSASVVNRAPPLFLSMPAELLLLVVGYLSPASTIALTLTCKALYAGFAGSSVVNSESPTEDQWELLGLLAHDMPDWIACRRCLRIHRNRNVELLLLVVNYLSPVSTTTLSLTCKALRAGMERTKLLNSTSPVTEQYELLGLLVRDMPNSIACPDCLRVHHPRNLHHYSHAIATRNKSGQLPACVVEDRYRNMSHLAPALFGSTVCQMIMMEHKLRPGSTRLLNKINQGATMTRTGNFLRHEKCEARLINDKLMVYERRLITPIWKADSFGEDWAFFNEERDLGVELYSDLICAHIRMFDKCWGEQCKSERVRICRICRTEFRVRFYYPTERGSCLAFEKWVDFGSGPSDPKWTTLLPKSKIWVMGEPSSGFWNPLDNPDHATDPDGNATIALLFAADGPTVEEVNKCFPIDDWCSLMAQNSTYHWPRRAQRLSNGRTSFAASTEPTALTERHVLPEYRTWTAA